MFDLEKISAAIGFPITGQETAKRVFKIYYNGYAQWCLANGVKNIAAPWRLVPSLFTCFEHQVSERPTFDENTTKKAEAFKANASKLKKTEVMTTLDIDQYNGWVDAYNALIEWAKFDGTQVNRAVFSEVKDIETGVTTYSMTVYKDKAHYTKKTPYEFAKVFKKQLESVEVSVKDLVPNKALLDELFGIDFKLNTLYDNKGLLSCLCYRRDDIMTDFVNALISDAVGDFPLNTFYAMCNSKSFPYLDPYFWLNTIEGADKQNPKQFLDGLLEKPKSLNDFTRTYLPKYVSRGVVEVPKQTEAQLQAIAEVTEAITKATARLYHLAYTNPFMLRVFPVSTYQSNGKEANTLDQWFSRLNKALQDHTLGFAVLKDKEVLDSDSLPEDSQDAAFFVEPKHNIMASIGDWHKPRDVEFLPYTSYTARLSLYDFLDNWSDINKAYKLPINLKNIKDYIAKYEFSK